MVNEKLTVTETRTIEAEGRENAERLRTLIERQGVRMTTPGEPPPTDRSEAPEAGTGEPVGPQTPKKPTDAHVETPTSVADESEDRSAPDPFPTPGELLGRLARKFENDVRSLVDKALPGPEVTTEQDRAPKEPEDRQTG